MGVYSGYLEESGSMAIPYDGHILDSVIEATSNDLKMFNAVIGLDFCEAYMMEADEGENKNDTSVATIKSAGKESIFKKIGNLISTFIRKIGEFFDGMITKLSNFFSNDKKLVQKYNAGFEKNASTYELSDYTILNGNIDTLFIDEMKDIESKYDDLKRTIDSSNDKEAINKVVSDYDSKSGQDKETIDAILFGDTVNNITLTSVKGKGGDQVAIIKDVMNNPKKIINNIKTAKKQSIENLKKVQAGIKETKKNTSEDLELTKLNAEYKLIGKVCKNISKSASAYCNATQKYISIVRKTFIKVAKGSSNKESNNDAEEFEDVDVEESVILDYIIGESSDIYVENMLGM